MFLNVMDERKKKQIFRPDMINMLMKLRTEQQKDFSNNETKPNKSTKSSSFEQLQRNQNWTDDDLIAQCFFCFFAGFDSTSKLLAFMAYELAINQDIQQKLYEEIKQSKDNLNGSESLFDVITQLKYFDQVVNETLRRWPPDIIGLRKCTKDIEIDLGGAKVNIERGTGIWIAVSALHHDHRNFETPMRFDPERFSDINKHKIKPGTFIPFGIGPRNCIG